HIEQIIEEYGFVRNRAARALGRGKTGLVDLVVPRLDDDYFFSIVQGVEQALKETGVRLVLTSTHYKADEEFEWIDTVTDRSSDGVLLVLPSDEAIQRLAQQDMPFVVIHNQGGLPAAVPTVTITSWDGGFAATNHLISLGHRRIAYIGKNVSAMDAIERFAGYRTALEVASLPLDPELQCEGNFNTDDGYHATKALMALPEPPTAIFAGNDHHAIGVYRALYELGISVPRQVSVIGFDNLAYTELMNPALTTIHVPRVEMGRAAVTMLLKLIAGETLDFSLMTLPTRLIERESCAPAASAL
ncbi:MAG TPA: LacI family DNA-binding transcriptional regulator, partial [Ktedonobacteraceae bacterium]